MFKINFTELFCVYSGIMCCVHVQQVAIIGKTNGLSVCLSAMIYSRLKNEQK